MLAEKLFIGIHEVALALRSQDLFERSVLALGYFFEFLSSRGNSSRRDYYYLLPLAADSCYLLHQTCHNLEVEMISAGGKEACAEFSNYSMVRH